MLEYWNVRGEREIDQGVNLMRKPYRYTAFLLILAVTLASIIPAMAAPLAQDPVPEPLPCEGATVAGTVVAVDPATGTVTVQLSDETQCTVNITVDESHPIVLLLGKYFGDVSADNLEEALNNTQGCVSFDGTAYSWVDCETAVEPNYVKIISYDPVTNTFTALKEDGTSVTFSIEDPEAAGIVKGALEVLAIEWALEGDGDLSQVSEQIAAYHEDGMGFGVLVKLYAIAQEHAEDCLTAAAEDGTTCPTVEELVALFQSGVGMGQIFKEYGKPDKLGVGHVRQEVNDKTTGKDKDKNKDKTNNGKDKSGDNQNWSPSKDKKDKPPKEDKLKGNCNAVSKNGKPKNGVTCP
jgi:DNA-binding FrmR family transcriptional regulator